MNVSTKLDNLVVITFSRRNLEGLIRQLDALGGSTRSDAAQIQRRIDGTLVIVTAEEDAVHYNSEQREEKVRGEAGWSGPGDSHREEILMTGAPITA